MPEEMPEVIVEPIVGQPAIEDVEAVEPTKTDIDDIPTQEDVDEEKDLRDEKSRYKKGGVQDRIDDLTRKFREAERRASYFEGLAAPTAQDTAANAAKPTSDQFDDYGDFVEALTDWKVAQKTQSMQSEAAKGVLQNERQANYAERLEDVKATIPDFMDVVSKSNVSIADHVGELVMDSAKGPEILYHLAQNPSIAATLNGLSERRAAMEIGRLEVQLEKPVVKRQSQAPTPITPIAQGVTGKVNLDTADMASYIAERRKMGAQFY